MKHKGTVYWITGLSGSGKSTIGSLLCKKLRTQGKSVIYLDGDSLREILGNGYGYSKDDRKKLGLMYGRLCNFLASQGFDVICATISMFSECWKWNRKNIQNYIEIYLKVPKDVLVKRDKKGLYSSSNNEDVVGVNLEVEEPISPDMTIVNDGLKSPDYICAEILANFAKVEV